MAGRHGHDDDDPDVVVVADPEDTRSQQTPKTPRVGTAALLQAIEDIPAKVAARVGGGGTTGTASGGATPEVTFAPEVKPTTEDPDQPDADPVTGPPPTEAHRAAFGFPHRARREEIGV
jgi:hypothetical protein